MQENYYKIFYHFLVRRFIQRNIVNELIIRLIVFEFSRCEVKRVNIQ